MPAAPKRRPPANDLQPRASQRMSCVALPRPRRDRRIYVAVFAAIAFLGAGLIGMAMPGTKAAIPHKQPAPFDITLAAPPPEFVSGAKLKKESLKKKIATSFRIVVEDQTPPKTSKLTLRTAYHAAAHDPLNMFDRLKLATLYDRAGDKAAALELYRQVLAAYERDDPTLPRKLDTDAIARRAAYLASE
ncbi:MAG: hypothetical protein KGI97_05155 [Alphaproteobacteria bacterium]|nr:hypothetical protein [Alphaproteobacteria bacterium]